MLNPIAKVIDQSDKKYSTRFEKLESQFDIMEARFYRVEAALEALL